MTLLCVAVCIGFNLRIFLLLFSLGGVNGCKVRVILGSGKQRAPYEMTQLCVFLIIVIDCSMMCVLSIQREIIVDG